jgi:transposase
MNLPAIDALPDDIQALKQLVLAQKSLLENQDVILQQAEKSLQDNSAKLHKKAQRIEFLEEYIRLLKHQRFGCSSEQHAMQPDFFNEAEQCADDDLSNDNWQATECAETAGAASTVSPRRAGRRPLPAHLPRVKIYHALNGAEAVCPCGCAMDVFDEVLSEQLGVIPAQLYVIQHCRKKYRCTGCASTIKTAPLPPQPLPKSNASPELIAFIAISKFIDGLPYYRQEKIWERFDIDLPRATMATWIIGGGNLVHVLINVLRDYLLDSAVIHMDETPVQVLKEPDKPPRSQSYFWVQRSGDLAHPVVLFHYSASHSSAVARELLPDYQGYLVSDDYGVYANVAATQGLTQVHCNDHARRKFKEAALAEPKQKGRISRAGMALNYYQKLYAIERRLNDASADSHEKYRVRQTESVPLLAQFKAWIDKTLPEINPESKFGKALSYTHRLWATLTRYCDDGRLPISNILVENAIRPLAISRKNFLFFDTPKGAQASAYLYSLIMTAKANDLDPFHYLRHVFTELPKATTLEDIEQLLPWNVDRDAIKKPPIFCDDNALAGAEIVA